MCCWKWPKHITTPRDTITVVSLYIRKLYRNFLMVFLCNCVYFIVLRVDWPFLRSNTFYKLIDFSKIFPSTKLHTSLARKWDKSFQKLLPDIILLYWPQCHANYLAFGIWHLAHTFCFLTIPGSCIKFSFTDGVAHSSLSSVAEKKSLSLNKYIRLCLLTHWTIRIYNLNLIYSTCEIFFNAFWRFGLKNNFFVDNLFN